MACNITTPTVSTESAELDILDKFKKLMMTSVEDDSVYERAKDTFKVLSDDYSLTDKEKAEVIATHIANMTTQITQAAMSTSLAWAKEERDGAFDLMLKRAQSEKVYVESAVAKEQVCLTQKQTEKICADIKVTTAASIRENGKITEVASDGCTVTDLDNSGLNYTKIKQIEASKYQILADAYRKSGVVKITTDSDQFEKGTSGDKTGNIYYQSMVAYRQHTSFEDSKLNHACNASSQTVGQLLASDIPVNEGSGKAILDMYSQALAELMVPTTYPTDLPGN